MSGIPFPLVLRLQPGQTLVLRHGTRERIAVQAGTVHWTRQGDLQDHFCGAGETLDLRGASRVVIEPARLGESVLLGVPAPGRWRWDGWDVRRAFARFDRPYAAVATAPAARHAAPV